MICNLLAPVFSEIGMVGFALNNAVKELSSAKTDDRRACAAATFNEVLLVAIEEGLGAEA